MHTQFSEIDDIAVTLEISPTRDSDKTEGYLHVPPDAVMFSLGALRLDGESVALPEGLEIALFRDEKQIVEGDEHAIFVERRLVGYLEMNPPEGRWKIEVRSATTESFVFAAGILRKSLSLLSIFKFDRCKACKATLKPILLALLVKLTAGVAGVLHAGNIAAAIAHLPAGALDALHHATGLPVDWLKTALGAAANFTSRETPWAKLARIICEKLRLCP